jgi:DNA modification methylase
MTDRQFLENIDKSWYTDYNVVPLLEHIARITKTCHGYVFGAKADIGNCIQWAKERKLNWDLLVAHKLNPVPTCNNKYLPDTDLIFYFRGKGSRFNNGLPLDCYRKVKPVFSKASEFGHPTEKDEGLIARLLRVSTAPGDFVVEPYAGSGTTCVVAERMGMNWVGVEINPKFHDIASRRVQTEISQGKLFE